MKAGNTTNYKCQECGQIVHSRQYHPKECCVSFKAGYDKALTQLADMTEECKQMGRKEVVEFVEEYQFMEHPTNYYKFTRDEWRKFKKEKGIK